MTVMIMMVKMKEIQQDIFNLITIRLQDHRRRNSNDENVHGRRQRVKTAETSFIEGDTTNSGVITSNEKA